MNTSRTESFKNALKGLIIAWREELNFKLEVVIAFAVIVLGYTLCISRSEWLALMFSIGFVLVTELVNTALENVCDVIQPKTDEHIGKIKDLAAGAVLLASLLTISVGCIIFLPHLSI